MKIAAILLILISIAVIGYFGTGQYPQLAPATEDATAAGDPGSAARDDVTLRSTTAGDIVGFVVTILGLGLLIQYVFGALTSRDQSDGAYA